MKAPWKVVLALLLGLPALVGAQPCNSTKGQLAYCNALTDAVMFGFPRYTTAQLPPCGTTNKGAVAFDTTSGEFKNCDGSAWAAFGGGGGAPTDATYITQTANGSLSAEQALGSLSTGCLGVTTTTGVVAARTITGTANQITVANGDCSGAPTISIPSSPAFAGTATFGDNTTGGNVTVNATLGSELAPALTAGNWTVGAGWESPIVGPGLIKNAAGTGTQTPNPALTITAGAVYRVSVTVTGLTVAGLTWTLGGTNSAYSANSAVSADGTYTEYITALTTGNFTLTPTVSASRFTVSAVSIKKVTAGTGTITVGGSGEIDGSLTVGGGINLWSLAGTGGAGGVNPSISFSPGTTASIFFDDNSGSNILGFRVGGTPRFAGSSTGLRTTSGGLFSWTSSSNIAGTEDTWIGRAAAANVRLGGADSATPIAQTFSAQSSRGGTDTDVAGGDLTIQPGAGTGAATGSSLIFKTPLATGSGSTQQTQTEYFRLNSSAATYTKTGIGTTSADGMVLTNTTAAANGAQQYSPRVRLRGNGWETTGGSSVTHDWVAEVRPNQSSASASTLVLAQSVGGAAYVDRAIFGNTGGLTLYNDLTMTNNGYIYLPQARDSGLVHGSPHASNSTTVTGGTTSTGARFTFYGSTHATTPNQAIFTASGGMSITDLALTAGTMTAERSANLLTSTSSYTWTNAQVVTALGTTGNITVATLPAKTQVLDAMVIITGQAATSTTLTVSCGRTGAGYIDYIVASDAKAAVNTVYGDASAERGTNLTGYDLPSYTGTTDVICQFVKTGSDPTASTGRVILTTRLLP